MTARRRRAAESFPAGLAPREWNAAALVATGLENAEIAVELGVTFNTAKTYVQGALVSSGSRNRVELALWYLRVTGRLIPDDSPHVPYVPRQRPAKEAPCRAIA